MAKLEAVEVQDAELVELLLRKSMVLKKLKKEKREEASFMGTSLLITI